MMRGPLTTELLSVLGSAASLVALALYFRPRSASVSVWEAIAWTIATVLLVVFVIARVRDHSRSAVRAFHSPDEIRNFMRSWISGGARVAIFSRDMSWVDEDGIRELLRTKSRRHELVLCLPHEIPLSTELRSLGAEVHVYPELDLTPASRFTIRNVGTYDSEVAIGRSINGVHTIQKARIGHDPLYAVAADLLAIVTRLERCRNGSTASQTS
jgi:hypothetical protein